ncbi:unnamed protein product [Psylliodes chrysocephalus]|uniref:Uncharacterized protein n=1 Tax=Psylliodes chrysocephalus TaxID=3402493 RepID=A0A9P0D5U1_9CUCU|nr:unnamed protein product [Psylliodes chrysocephala]
MKQNDLFAFEPLLKNNIKKSGQTISGEILDFSGVYSFQFRAENAKSIFIKHTVNGEFNEVNIAKKGRLVSTPLTPLSGLIKKYTEPLKIVAKKIQNVKSLLPYIPPVYHPFFNSLSAAAGTENEVENVELFD